MKTRLIGAALVFTVVLVALYAGVVAWALLMALAAALAAAEVLRLVQGIGRAPTLLIGLALAPALTVSGLRPELDLVRLVLAVAVIAALVAQIARPPDRRSTDDLAATLAWPAYIGVLLSFAVILRGLSGGLGWTALLLAYVWANDSFAYLGGRAFGRRPFFASLSPRKTLEGALSGAAAAVMVGLGAPTVAAALAGPLASLPHAGSGSLQPLADASPVGLAVLALAVSVVAPLGDLSKSFVKRQAGVKDSGSMIPGHGGVLDRLDSMLFASPVVYYFVSIALSS